VLAEIKRPLTVDNFEGIAVRRNEKARRSLPSLDDNYNPLQRTLLLMFALKGPDALSLRFLVAADLPTSASRA